MAKYVSDFAGLVIAKYKSFGSLPFGTYTKLYANMVWSIINYSALVWGDIQFAGINSVQHRAARFVL
jgi:hypothetical protein